MEDSRTALITGASSGIGAAYARALAARGFSLVLVARRKVRLEALRKELEKRHGVTVRVVAADLSKAEGIRQVERVLGAIGDLDLLVNNAGFGLSAPFETVDPAKHEAMVNVHVLATVRLTRAALPALLTRRRGGIINVSSISPYFSLPGNTAYSSTKAFVTAFSRAVHDEILGSGVHVQAVCPGFTHTEMHDTPEGARRPGSRAIPEWLFMSAEEVAERSLKALERNRAVFIPGVKNRLLVGVGRLTPRWLVRRTSWRRQQ